MSESPHPLAELVKSRLREFLREPGYVFWVFGFPLLLAVGLGIAFREKAPELPRVAVGCALVGDPELLFLDEPTTGLDPRARKSLWSIVEKYREQGRSVLLTTHYMEEAAALCDRIAVMDHGKIIALGTPRSLVDSLGMVQFVEFEVAHPLDEQPLSALPSVDSVVTRGLHYRLRVERSLAALSLVLEELGRQGVQPIGLSTHQATLDDVFLHLTGRALEHAATEAP